MTTSQPTKKITLTVEFLNKTVSSKFGGKILSIRPSGSIYCYSGATKKECIANAKKAFRYNASYSKMWSEI